jgi:hypothetical protein
MKSKRCYEVQIKSLCPPQAYLRLEAHSKEEAADMTQRFLRSGSPEDFEKALRVLHMAFDDAIGCGQYEIGNIRPVETLPEGGLPVLKREDIEGLGTSLEETEHLS